METKLGGTREGNSNTFRQSALPPELSPPTKWKDLLKEKHDKAIGVPKPLSPQKIYCVSYRLFLIEAKQGCGINN